MFENKRFLDYYSVDRRAKTMKTSHEGYKDSQGIILTYSYLTMWLAIFMYRSYVYIVFAWADQRFNRL